MSDEKEKQDAPVYPTPATVPPASVYPIPVPAQVPPVYPTPVTAPVHPVYYTAVPAQTPPKTETPSYIYPTTAPPVPVPVPVPVTPVSGKQYQEQCTVYNSS